MYQYASPTLTIMLNTARKAGRLLVRDFSEIEKLKITEKSSQNFVSSADLRSEKIILGDLKDFKPNYNIIAEEKGLQEGTDKNFTWIVDPLDGTTNFLHGIPLFTISIALRKKNEIIASVIYEPIGDNLYWAEKGKGAYLNNTRLRIGKCTEIKKSLASYSLDFHEVIQKETSFSRYFGCVSLTLAYVASGKIDLFVGKDLKIWDIAGGTLLVKEAGGIIDDLNKKENVLDSGNVLAANTRLFEKAQKVFAS